MGLGVEKVKQIQVFDVISEIPRHLCNVMMEAL